MTSYPPRSAKFALRAHKGHTLTIAAYGALFGKRDPEQRPSVLSGARSREEIANLAVECEDCFETLLDFDVNDEEELLRAEKACADAMKYLTATKKP